MNYVIYIVIFFAKTIELALGTLRLIVVANGKKMIGAILQGLAALVWVFAVGLVVVDVTSDPLKIVAFALGSAFGSYLGSLLEEKMALGSNMLMAIIDKSLEQPVTTTLRNNGFAVTVVEGQGKEKTRAILMIMSARKNRNKIVGLIKQIDYEAMIISESASTLTGGHKENEKTKN
ncbi:MAG: DUF2179 domain-containing protein [Firmicutes bacterium]|nr:DUF2179 domain-containing protein [Bacillota bacterium]